MGIGWWDSLLGGSWWKTVGLVILCVLAGLIFIPCCVPCLREPITRSIIQMQAVAVPVGTKGEVHKMMIMPLGKVLDP